MVATRKSNRILTGAGSSFFLPGPQDDQDEQGDDEWKSDSEVDHPKLQKMRHCSHKPGGRRGDRGGLTGKGGEGTGEIPVVLDPAWVPMYDGSRLKMIGDEPDEKGRGQQRRARRINACARGGRHERGGARTKLRARKNARAIKAKNLCPKTLREKRWNTVRKSPTEKQAQEEQNKTQRHESMNMEERHARVEG